MRTSRGAVPDDKALHKLCHGQAGLAGAGGLSRAQADVLRAYHDGWEWSPYMPRPRRVRHTDTTPTTSRYRVPPITPVATWDEPMLIVRIVYTASEGDMISAIITIGFEHPRRSCFYEEEVFWRIMRAAGLAPAEWFTKHQSNGFGGTPYKKSAVFAFKSKRMRANGAPLRDCGCLYEGETEIDECWLFYPPSKVGNGRHKHTVMSTRDVKYKKLEQYHYVAPNAYQAAFVADHHDAEQVALARVAVADICAGLYAMGMMGVRSVPLDERTEVDTGWGKMHNAHLELNLGFKGDPGTSAYE